MIANKHLGNGAFPNSEALWSAQIYICALVRLRRIESGDASPHSKDAPKGASNNAKPQTIRYGRDYEMLWSNHSRENAFRPIAEQTSSK